MDFYAGYKKEVMPGLTLDGGALQYYYPTKGMPSTYINANILIQSKAAKN